MYDRLWPHASLALVTPYSVFGISRALIPSPSPSSYSLLSALLFRLPTLFPPLSLLLLPTFIPLLSSPPHKNGLVNVQSCFKTIYKELLLQSSLVFFIPFLPRCNPDLKIRS